MSKKPKRANLKPPGKCIFDGRTGLTKAHIFPVWLNEHIAERTDRHVLAVGITETFVPQTVTPSPWAKVRQGDSGTLKVRKVCGPCNSGWLGSLETPAKPHVLSLMNGEDVVIDQQMQKHLAAWLCAITMLVDADAQAGSAISQVDRDFFQANREPPQTWRIWIARYCGNKWQEHRIKRVGLRVQSTPEINADRLVCNTQNTTLVLRQFCAHIFSSTVVDDFAGYEGVELQKLWPLTGENFAWTRAARLDDAGVVALNEALAAGLKPVA